jgi:hypothetical protein
MQNRRLPGEARPAGTDEEVTALDHASRRKPSGSHTEKSRPQGRLSVNRLREIEPQRE